MLRSGLPTSCRPGNAAMLLVWLMVSVYGCDAATDTVAPQPQLDVAPQASYTAIRGDPDAIMDLVDAATAAWTAKDADAYAAIYAENIQVVSPVGSLLSGRDVFRAQHVFLFSGPFAGSTQTITVRDIAFLTGTIALVAQDVTLTGYVALPPGLPSMNGVVRTRVTWVVVKRGRTWEIAFQQMTPQLF